MIKLPYGFRILGSCHEERRLVDHAGAFLGYASVDPRASVEHEAYLSAFTFGDDFCDLLKSTGSVKGFDGACWAAWLWFDIDRTDLDTALRDARRLALFLVERYSLDDDAMLIFFSGSKGFHIGLPSSLWAPEPSTMFHRVCRRLAERMAEVVGVMIDTGVYDRVRAFRAPNSRHPKTYLHKRQLSLDELQGLSLDAVRKLAEMPTPFDVPTPPPICKQAIADWLAAGELVHQASEAKAKRTTSANGAPALNRQTLAFIREGAAEGDRHRLLYSAARNLAEFGCPPALAHSLLTEPGLDCGLSPSDVRRQVDCGLSDQAPLPVEQPAPPSPLPVLNADDLGAQLAALWQGTTPTIEPILAGEPAPPSPNVPAEDLQRKITTMFWTRTTPTIEPILAGEPLPENRGDAWEHPLDRLGVIDPTELEFPFDANDGPYSRKGDRP